MKIEERPVLSSGVQERDIDLILVQLVQTSPSFRKWLGNQLVPDYDLDSFLGVSHSVATIHGESDIEIGFTTEQGGRHLILVENKIDAQFQDGQIDRYFKRGEAYMQSGDCEDFTVGLIAPAGYVNESNRLAFDMVVTYENIISQLSAISHDGTPFFQEVFDLSIKKRALRSAGYPEVTQQIVERFQERSGEFPDIIPFETTNNLVRFRSINVNHPEGVRYEVWVRGDKEARKTMVRLAIDGGLDDGEIGRLKSAIADHFDGLERFDLKKGSIMYTVFSHVEAERIDSEYVDKIVSKLRDLTIHYHSRLVGHQLSDS